MNIAKNKISKRNAVYRYVFFGTFVGLIALCVVQGIFAIYLYSISASELHSSNLYYQVIAGLLLYMVFGYPFALIIGFIPALVSGLIIHSHTNENAKFLYAGFIGFVVSLIFYGLVFFFLQNQIIDISSEKSTYSLLLYLALDGAIAAAVTRYWIHRIESKAYLTNVSC